MLFTQWKKPKIEHNQTSFASQHSPQLNSCKVKDMAHLKLLHYCLIM